VLRSTPYSFIIPSRGTAPLCCQLTPWRRGEGTAALYSAGSMRIILHFGVPLRPTRRSLCAAAGVQAPSYFPASARPDLHLPY
jgi:hypothetical protein